MPYTPYKTAAQWKTALGNSVTPQTAVYVDWLGALTPATPYTPYNTGTQWQAVLGPVLPQPLQIQVDILGTETDA